MKKLFIPIAVFSIIVLSACKKNCGSNTTYVPQDNYIKFGHFYGECGGETCMENFIVTDHLLFEDTKDDYPTSTNFYNGNYVIKTNSNIAAINTILNTVPQALLNDNNIVIGQPDAGDWGGDYFEYNKNGIHKFWLLDKQPTAYSNFVRAIDSCIKLAQ
jgi:hypothetical protein